MLRRLKFLFNRDSVDTLIWSNSTYSRSSKELFQYSDVPPTPTNEPEEIIDNIDYDIISDPNSLFNSEKLYSLSESQIVSLLKRDDVGLHEIIIWINLLNWGIKNTPELVELEENTSRKWTEKDFEKLKEKLKNCIEWIRFFQLSPQEFAEIPSTYINSTILTGRHATILSSWMVNLSNEETSTANFNLLFKASEEDLNLNNFYAKCCNKGPILLIIKFYDSDYIVGGYIPLNYRRNDNKRRSSTKNLFSKKTGSKNSLYEKSFIFSFIDKYRPEDTAVISRVLPQFANDAVFEHPAGGPCFGTGPDLWINIDSKEKFGHNVPSSYEHDILDYHDNVRGSFEWEDFEIFQIVQN
nr:14418_t:CDS:2 [Entrophospora candida]